MARTETELVRLAQAGDREAFGVLVERHRRTVYALAVQKGLQAAEAEDVAQEVFIRAYHALGTLQDPARFGGWVYGIAAHVSADGLRARGKNREAGTLDGLPEPAEAGGADRVEWEEEARRIFRALEELSEEQRVALTLRYLEGLSPKQIAERLGEPRGTVRSRLHHALAYLQQAFGGAHGPAVPARGRAARAESAERTEGEAER